MGGTLLCHRDLFPKRGNKSLQGHPSYFPGFRLRNGGIQREVPELGANSIRRQKKPQDTLLERTVEQYNLAVWNVFCPPKCIGKLSKIGH